MWVGAQPHSQTEDQSHCETCTRLNEPSGHAI